MGSVLYITDDLDQAIASFEAGLELAELGGDYICL